MADTLRNLAYGAVLRSQPATQPPMLLPDTIQRLAMRQDSIGAPPRTTLAEMVGKGGTLAQRLANALSNYGATIPGTERRITLKDLTLGDAGQVVEDWSYGSPPTTGGNYATGGIGTLGLQPRAMDLLNLGGVAGGAAKAGKVGAEVLGPTLREMARKGIEGNLRATGGIQDLITWHGSPHTFDRFDASKIGTGEGAQAYGHGLYLAENPGVATEYRRTLSAGVPEVLVNGRRVAGTPFNSAANTLALSRDTITRADLAAYLESRINELGASSDPLARAGLLEAKKAKASLDKARDVVVNYDGTAGSLYKVDLPDSMIERMLDWDKPLSAQPMAVDVTRQARPGYMQMPPGNTKASDAYMALAESVGHDKAAQMFRKAKIPGIRYLDGGSRADGLGTSNFVIFPGEESALTILERNGRPLR